MFQRCVETTSEIITIMILLAGWWRTTPNQLLICSEKIRMENDHPASLKLITIRISQLGSVVCLPCDFEDSGVPNSYGFTSSMAPGQMGCAAMSHMCAPHGPPSPSVQDNQSGNGNSTTTSLKETRDFFDSNSNEISGDL